MKNSCAETHPRFPQQLNKSLTEFLKTLTCAPQKKLCFWNRWLKDTVHILNRGSPCYVVRSWKISSAVIKTFRHFSPTICLVKRLIELQHVFNLIPYKIINHCEFECCLMRLDRFARREKIREDFPREKFSGDCNLLVFFGI